MGKYLFLFFVALFDVAVCLAAPIHFEIVGNPGPGITPDVIGQVTNVMGQQGIDDIVFHGSAQQGFSPYKGTPFNPQTSDVDLGTTTTSAMIALAGSQGDPDFQFDGKIEHGPMRLYDDPQELADEIKAGRACAVVRPGKGSVGDRARQILNGPARNGQNWNNAVNFSTNAPAYIDAATGYAGFGISSLTESDYYLQAIAGGTFGFGGAGVIGGGTLIEAGVVTTGFGMTGTGAALGTAGTGLGVGGLGVASFGVGVAGGRGIDYATGNRISGGIATGFWGAMTALSAAGETLTAPLNWGYNKATGQNRPYYGITSQSAGNTAAAADMTCEGSDNFWGW